LKISQQANQNYPFPDFQNQPFFAWNSSKPEMGGNPDSRQTRSHRGRLILTGWEILKADRGWQAALRTLSGFSEGFHKAGDKPRCATPELDV
jgi:hypothetical protein